MLTMTTHSCEYEINRGVIFLLCDRITKVYLNLLSENSQTPLVIQPQRLVS